MLFLTITNKNVLNANIDLVVIVSAMSSAFLSFQYLSLLSLGFIQARITSRSCLRGLLSSVDSLDSILTCKEHLAETFFEKMTK